MRFGGHLLRASMPGHPRQVIALGSGGTFHRRSARSIPTSRVPALHDLLAQNAHRVHARVEAALQRAGRPAGDVRVIAVTKYVDATVAGALCASGERDLGENRVQELTQKAEALRSDPPHWHLIGSLQTNKVARALQYARTIHAVDRSALWELLVEQLRATPQAERPQLLLQVNTSGEATKHGFRADELPQFFERYQAGMRAEGLQPAGLMTMASLHGGVAAARRSFESLAALRDELRAQGAPLGTELSMGMSQDFEIAIDAGATMLRIGSAFFEGLL